MSFLTVIVNRPVHYRQKLYESISIEEDRFFTDSFTMQQFIPLFISINRNKKVLLLRDPSVILNWLVLTYCLIRGFKIIVWAGWFTDSRWANLLRLFMSKMATKNVFYSEGIRQSFVLKGISAWRTSSLPNNKFAVCHNIEGTRNSIALLGSVNERKGYIEFLDILDSKLTAPLEVRVIGTGVVLKEMRLRNYQFIKFGFYGVVTDDYELSSILADSFAVVSPSQIGLTVVDSFSCGCPVFGLIDAISGGEKESVVNGFNGYLCNNNQDLVDRILIVQGDKTLKLSLVENAHLTFNQLYNWNNYVDQFKLK